MAEVLKRLLNVEEYYKMAEVGIITQNQRVELIHGEIFDMSPVGSKHSSAVKYLNQLLKSSNQPITVGIQDPIRLDETNEPEPDISILKFREDFYADNHPGAEDILFIIEVSDSSIDHDLMVKKPLYASFGIPEYWIVDLESQSIEVNRDPQRQGYEDCRAYRQDDIVKLLDLDMSAKDVFLLS